MYVIVKQDAKNAFILGITGPFDDIDDAYENVSKSNDTEEFTVRFVDRP